METLTPTQVLRFNHNASTNEEAINYIENRAKQLLRFGYELSTYHNFKWGVRALFKDTKTGETYQSLYILKDSRNKGIYRSNLLPSFKVLTSTECNLAKYLFNNNIDFVQEDLTPFKEYEIISDYYGSDKAKRSGVYLMNHIDEGLAILEWIGASETAKKAYCLHPIYQSDGDLMKNYNHVNHGIGNIDGNVMIAVMEYRAIANEYLSPRHIDSLDEIRTSVLTDVNDMLIADKIQNRKDFELYHKDTHPRSKELTYYFMNWLAVLGITEEQYQFYKYKLL